MISPNLITAPQLEPVSIDEIKTQLRLSSDHPATEDLQIGIYRSAARKYYEWRTGRTIQETEWELILPRFPSNDFVELPRATPLVSITSVTYVDSNGTANIWNSANYIADIWNLPGRLVRADGESWPSFTAYPTAAVRIRYKAGIAVDSPLAEADDADKVPILLLAARLYDEREAVNVQDRQSVGQIAVKYGLEDFISLRRVRHLYPNE